MITIFTCPKPFVKEHIKTIQTNAIRSWTLLNPTPEIILLGDDKGVSEAAAELNVNHIPGVQYNERGIPILDSVFEMANEYASNDLLCYINSDIILMQDLIHAILHITKIMKHFLIVSKRWDHDISDMIDFNSPEVIKELKKKCEKKGKLHSPAGIDIHIFSSKVFKKVRMRPFVLGHGGYDNWFIWRTRSLNIPVIDITLLTMIIHQNHDYSHISPQVKSWKDTPDYQKNARLVGRWLFRYQINHAYHKLTPEGLKYRYIHPFLEPLIVIANLFFDVSISELLNKVPSIKRAIKQIVRK